MRNNKILTGQPTHTPKGAFNSFQGLQVASNLGLNQGIRSISKTNITPKPSSKTNGEITPDKKTHKT